MLGFDTNNNPHILYVEDSANTRRPAHIINGELLAVKVGSLANTIVTLNLPHEQATDRLVFALLSNLSAMLYGQKSTDSRTPELAGILADYAVGGILSAIGAETAPKQPSPAPCGQPERN